VKRKNDPIDAVFRAKLRAEVPNVSEFARQIGWSQGTLHKYMNGGGHASIDDIARMTAQLSNPASPRNKRESQLLQLFRRLGNNTDDEDDVFDDIRKKLRRRREQSKSPKKKPEGD